MIIVGKESKGIHFFFITILEEHKKHDYIYMILI